MPGKFQPLYRFAAGVARVPVSIITRRTWRGAEHLPRDTGFIAAANHLSEFDALTLMHFLIDNGIPVRMLAKEQLFAVPGLGWLMRSVGQIPVARGKKNGGNSLDAAIAALRAGECIGICPEGTLTRDPQMWPMRAKTGAARMALAARVPVIPIAQWGAQEVLGRYQRRPNLTRRANVTVVAGPPVDLSDLYDRADDHAAHVEATARIMAAITAQLAEIRGEEPPARPYDTALDGDPGKRGIAAADRERARQARNRR